MGDICLEFTIANIHDLQRQKEISFLVDTGSTRAWIPNKIADELGIQPAGTVALELADGSIKELPYGFCLFDFGGNEWPGTSSSAGLNVSRWSAHTSCRISGSS